MDRIFLKSVYCRLSLLSLLLLVVENIEKQRQPYPTLDAVYFLTPCRESVLRLVDDFAGHNGPIYKAAHIHFTSGNTKFSICVFFFVLP